jgi:hypothetical protein
MPCPSQTSASMTFHVPCQFENITVALRPPVRQVQSVALTRDGKIKRVSGLEIELTKESCHSG